MPFTRKRNRTYASRYRPRKRRRTVRARRKVDRQQNRRLMWLTKQVRPEYKYRDQYQASTVTTNWINLLPRPLTYIPQGDTNSERIGNKCKLHSIRLRGEILVDDTTNILRMLVVKFGRTDGNTIGVDDVLTDANATSPQHLFSNYARNGTQPYKVLWDKTWKLAGGPINPEDATSSTVKIFDFTVKLKGATQNLFYKLDTDTTPSKGYCYVICASDSLLGGLTVYMSSRIIFSG